jgi:hypothetical protein
VKGFRNGAACSVCGGPIGTRNRLGACIGCRTEALKAAAVTHFPIRPHMADKVAYYAARAALGLDLFAGSPWARLPGGHQRSLERQAKRAGTTGRIAPAHKVKKISE